VRDHATHTQNRKSARWRRPARWSACPTPRPRSARHFNGAIFAPAAGSASAPIQHQIDAAAELRQLEYGHGSGRARQRDEPQEGESTGGGSSTARYGRRQALQQPVEKAAAGHRADVAADEQHPDLAARDQWLDS
jgi:hypothetical protein